MEFDHFNQLKIKFAFRGFRKLSLHVCDLVHESYSLYDLDYD